MNPVLFLQTLLITTTAIQACLFKTKERSNKTLKLYGPWSDEESVRRAASNCECGKFHSENNGDSIPWVLNITASNLYDCVGTIITSNLVVTSHECIRIPDKTLHIFDSWRTQPAESSNFVGKESIILSKSYLDGSRNMVVERFPVEEIIPIPKYLSTWTSARFRQMELDLIILKVNADFTQHKYLSPVCIPWDKTALDFTGQAGYYFDLHTGVVIGTIFTRTVCQADHNTLSTNVDDDDDEDAGKTETGQVEALCLRWQEELGVVGQPKALGGPLFLQSNYGSRSFLAGTGSDVSIKVSGTGIEYTYSSNIIPMIKYLEHRAREHKSKWCKTPKLGLGAKFPIAEQLGKSWLWEDASIQKVLKERDESLDCVCGVPNKGPPDGRVVGGVEADPYEFGWMALVEIRHYGRKGVTSWCGGTIINDRMILSAAHCFVHDDKLQDPDRSNLEDLVVDPGNVVLKINLHDTENDRHVIDLEVHLVLIHPEYIPAKKLNYIDYDMAVLVLKTPLKFPRLAKNGFRPICLPKIGEKVRTLGKTALVAGWGYITPESDQISSTEQLRKIELPIIPIYMCRGVARAKVTDRFLCAGTLNKYKDAASGDSGGPLQMKRGKQWLQVGIVSWGQDKGAKTAALYTDLTHPDILPFIDYFAKRTMAQWCKSEFPV